MKNDHKMDTSLERVRSTEGLTASQMAPYGPYDHIVSMGNACEAKFEARAKQNSNKTPLEPIDAIRQWGLG